MSRPPSSVIIPADKYTPCTDLSVVTSYFNPCRYHTKLQNYSIFEERIRQAGIDLVTIECSFGDQPYEVLERQDVIRVRAENVMWQKERLINLALVSGLVKHKKVIWIDCDLLFENADWAILTSKMLDRYPVVQPFMDVVRLPRGHHAFAGEGEWYRSFAAVYHEDPTLFLKGKWDIHGHTGFAWAGRREWLAQHGLYDASIAGSADHMMAHAVCGDWTGLCIQRTLGMDTPHLRHFQVWAEKVHKEISGRLACVDGVALHLWHGEYSDRRYVDRHNELIGFRFDPFSDICLDDSGCWKWNSDKVDLHRWALRYFSRRKEDGG